MKITFTGISREEIVNRLMAKADENGKFADRLAATYGADNAVFHDSIVNGRHMAERNAEVARLIAAAESDALHMTVSDEGFLYSALVAIAPGYDTYNLYRVEFEEGDKIPGEITLANALAEGERVAAKTENL